MCVRAAVSAARSHITLIFLSLRRGAGRACVRRGTGWRGCARGGQCPGGSKGRCKELGQAERLRVALTGGGLRLSVLVIDLHELDFRELFEGQAQQVGDIEIPAFGCAGACQIDMGNAVFDLEPVITGEAVVEGRVGRVTRRVPREGLPAGLWRHGLLPSAGVATESRRG